MQEYFVNLFWDSEALVWIATSDQISGLVLESGSLDVLIERVRYAAPELLQLKGLSCERIRLKYQIERLEEVSLHG
ncbi:hypothetical protein FACS189418_2080 [Clostridia bacterium]|nr:hypothetical protein FACS189418_2080 [Clostridia bacterium]